MRVSEQELGALHKGAGRPSSERIASSLPRIGGGSGAELRLHELFEAKLVDRSDAFESSSRR
jgi:hypothetical protein